MRPLQGVAVIVGSLVISSAAMADILLTPNQIMTWPTRSFDGETHYEIVAKDGANVLQAQSRGQASARYLEREINLDETPYLHWCWQVNATYPGLDETTKAGDDYPARVYVARKTGLLPWQVQSVNYVWSSTQDAGNTWTNAFTDRAELMALQGGSSSVGEWVAEVRDVRADFTTLFDESVTTIDGVALMSDGDNSGNNATAWFSQLGFSASEKPPACP
ncbi:DUF3047 domain-containing protein [Halomonas llamarensis]|uniref:DUF3047 domain-containing protein n=1 Tax=Halomonas llamarensis TaxID=2945104 RepID=A0ABT0SS19_9GAMM|nr:DUF3047 domain-containing protein [Halomonas llamarensis]MCL7930625.1 DUF3047 domain-containing protein [Halomonas llamarensis]